MAAATAAAVLVALGGLSGCTDHNTSSGTTATKTPQGLASASAEARRRLNAVKHGINAKDEVRLGTPTTSAGHAVVEVTAHNTASSTKSFAVQVNYTDTNGNLLDTVVVTLSDVPAGRTANAKARSTRELTGHVKTAVARALRF